VTAGGIKKEVPKESWVALFERIAAVLLHIAWSAHLQIAIVDPAMQETCEFQPRN
jgi:hypothetical protein